MNFVPNVCILLTSMNQESQLLDLANDCFRFVLRFFDVISTSAPHIYHSALLLCPKKSIVWTLYGPQVRPMARVIWGIPVSWDPSIANIRFPGGSSATGWSPCSRFIAAAHNSSSGIVILDAVTLEQLHTMHFPHSSLWLHFTFSPGGHLLTAYAYPYLVSWDIQTGGLLSKISIQKHSHCHSVSYSGCETMIGSLIGHGNYTISIYNVLSGTFISSHIISHAVEALWTLGKYLQFATVEPGSIIMWQVSFTSKQAPTRVSSLSTPNNFSQRGLVLLPTLSRLAFIFGDKVVVWDGQHHKLLLHSICVGASTVSLSSDGHSLVCGTWGREFYIWKELPTGYVSHQKLVSGAVGTKLLVSPNGESVISPSGTMLQLWHITNYPTSISGTLMQTPQHNGDFCVEFPPDESLVAFTDVLGSTVTILDMKSGNPWLAVDTGTRISGLKITEDKIIVVGHGEIITLDLPARGCVENTRRDINNSIHITTFQPLAPDNWLHASISPNLKYIAIVDRKAYQKSMYICDMCTGRRLNGAYSHGHVTGFTPSDHVWCADNNGRVDQWEILKKDGSDAIELGIDKKPLNDYYWNAPDGHKLTDDGWIISPSREWLLWLPHSLQQGSKVQMKWSGKFLAVWNGSSPEPCILEFGV